MTEINICLGFLFLVFDQELGLLFSGLFFKIVQCLKVAGNQRSYLGNWKAI